MYKIVNKKILCATVTMMDIEAPFVAAKALPGQFIILRVDESSGERIPLTVAGYDRMNGTVRIIFQTVGATTKLLSEKKVGDYISDFVGPLGVATKVDGLKKVLIVGGGVGCAIALPIAQKLRKRGCDITSVIGFRSKDVLILEEEFAACSDRLTVMTDDGSAGQQGNVCVALREMFARGETFDEVFAIGPLVMMKYVVEEVRPTGIPCTVSMNPIMIDGTGMCGGCRLTLIQNGKRVTRFACVDGPDFNGYEVDFDEAISRSRMYPEFERQAFHDTCNLFSKAPEDYSEPTQRIKQHIRVEMPTQSPAERARNFHEVSLGYTADMAVLEATDCLECKNPKCVKGCPVSIDIPGFIAKIKHGDFDGAYDTILKSSCLPAICGRVCPQENQCEAQCVRGIKGQPIAIGRLERFVADWHNENSEGIPPVPKFNGHMVAVIGSGPSGLTCAGELAKLGYDVTIFEALHTEGGVLVYGIPEFRLPKDIVKKEVATLKAMGVKIRTNMVVGKTVTVDEIFDAGFEAVFVGTGAGLPNFMGIPGESLKGVYSANEFLTRSNLMKAYRDDSGTPIMKGGRVAVVGGGNVAMDAARTALRLGAEKVYVVYRRSMEELPARKEEVDHAIKEGIAFTTLTNPTEILEYRNENDPTDPRNGFVGGMRCVKMKLGDPDEKGRRKPVPVENSEFRLNVDTVIMAIGTSPNPLIKSTTAGLEVNDRGGIIIRENGETTKDNVFAGGDAVTGAATVISAMGAGKTAAQAIHEKLMHKS